MGRYTLNSAPEADIIIQSELEYIVERLTDVLQDHIRAILLTGGFGRGEGAVVKENNHYRPVNDYDIVVAVHHWSKIPGHLKEKLAALEVEINGKVSVKQVDIAYIDCWKLALPVPTLARYEIKNGNIPLYVKSPVQIRCMPSKLLPLYEATTYFRTRIAGLLIARLILDHQIFPEKKQLELAFLEINKAFLVPGDAYLIQHKSYHFSYAKRKNIFLDNKVRWEIPDEITDKYLTAIDNKLHPNFSRLTCQALNNQWVSAAQLIGEEFLRLESYRYGIQMSALDEYDKYVTRNVYGLKNVLSRLEKFFNRESKPELIKNRLIGMYLLEATVHQDTTQLQRVAELLNTPLTDWEQLTIIFLNRWHPNGIIAEITKGIIC